MRVDGVRGGTCYFLFCSTAKAQTAKHAFPVPAKAHSSPSRSKFYRPNAAAAVFTPVPPLSRSQHSSQSQPADYCAAAFPQRPCMRARGLVPRTKLTPLTDAYRSVVCTYFCASLLWRVLATILETCSLSELLKGRALRAVPSLGTASYKTCHKNHGPGRRH